MVTPNYNKNEKELLATTIVNYDYKTYCECCEIDEIEPAEEGSQEHLDYMRQMTQDYWEDDFYYAQRIGKCCNPCLVTGTLGLWWGKPEIEPTFFNNLKEAMAKCIENADDIEIFVEDGKLQVYAHHHDGTNVFEIRPLSSEGWDKWDEHMDEGTDLNLDESWFDYYAA